MNEHQDGNTKDSSKTRRNNSIEDKQKKKKDTLRYNEYYNMQATFDNLYELSSQGSKFKKLYGLIVKDENILLAYRNIKSNSGSTTAGTNGHTIEYWEKKSTAELLTYVKRRLEYYIPLPVRRVEIPKPNGKMRPLGIPCIEDRIIQQCIKQVLEPICEAKFHPHSFGFRPNRGTHHAYSYLLKKVNADNKYFLVDVDIKGFFDNVNHAKLLKQIWAMGICDKKLICIIGSMLKAEIQDIGIPTKGVPQGGILSPLLSNIVLNELDWWISDQWETFETRYQYTQTSSRYAALKRASKLKEVFIVRYADDFKLICNSLRDAKRLFTATKLWLKERLDLDVSEEKSNVVDVRKRSSEFLGFRLKARRKRKTWVIGSHMTDKAFKNANLKIREAIEKIRKYPSSTAVNELNRVIAGLQDYYAPATDVSLDFSKLDARLYGCFTNRLKKRITSSGVKSEEYERRYRGYNIQRNVLKVAVYPIYAIRNKKVKQFNQQVNNYTIGGRSLIHRYLEIIDNKILNYLARNPVPTESVEYNDNRLSLYSAQRGKCIITNTPLDESLVVHRIDPLLTDGRDKYNNLMLVQPLVHKLIHINDNNTIHQLLSILKFDKKTLKKLNNYRLKVGNELIMSD